MALRPAPLFFIALLAGGLAACGGSGSPGGAASTGAGSPPPTSAATTTLTLIPAEASQYGPATLVHGVMTCIMIKAPATADEKGTHARDNRAECTYRMNDPRVTGTSTDPWLVDSWTNAQDETVLIQWGPSRLKTAGGSWDGSYSGAFNGQQDTIAYWYRGKGAYDGLTYHAWITPSPPGTDVEGWLMEGIIYPGEPPKLP